jgi:CHAT domain-containing protein
MPIRLTYYISSTIPQRKAKNRLLAFAPKYNADTVFFENEKLILTQLPGVQREVDLIAGEIKIDLFRNENATEENFRKHSNNYDILHLAMHAFINDSLPAFSRFAFAQNNDNQPQKDGWLNTADIYNLDINARLTVLSACNTGSGNLRKGEGVMSLARGFLYAGCPTIVMTLWEVEDNAGTKIMSSFYQNLKKGRSTDEALRLAKLNYLENANPRMAHPHYWLGYVSIGNSIPLFRSYDYYFFGLLILAFAGIITDQVIRLKKARKKRIN